MAKPTAKKMPPKVLQLNLQRSGEYVEFCWHEIDGADGPWDPYSVSLHDLKAQGDALRDALSALQDTNWDDDDDPTRLSKLHKLAYEGAKAYELLLDGNDDVRFSKLNADDFRKWFKEAVLDQQPGTWRVQIVHQQYDIPIIPWGLVFTPTDDKQIDALSYDCSDYENFWCLSFQLACRGMLFHKAREIDQRIKAIDSTEIVVSIDASDEQVLQASKDMGLEPPNKVGEFAISSLEAFGKLPAERPETSFFWYINLPSKDSSLLFSREEISVSELTKIQEQVEKLLIIFIDGGAILNSADARRWIDAILDVGKSGLIAAEVEITHPRLKYFGWTFFKEIMEGGKPLISAIDHVRRKNWPQSLFYGVYCDPIQIFFDPPPVDKIQRADDFLSTIRKHIE